MYTLVPLFIGIMPINNAVTYIVTYIIFGDSQILHMS